MVHLRFACTWGSTFQQAKFGFDLIGLNQAILPQQDLVHSIPMLTISSIWLWITTWHHSKMLCHFSETAILTLEQTPSHPSSDKWSTLVPYPLGKEVVKTRPLPIPLRSFVAFRIFNFRTLRKLENARGARRTVRSAVLVGWKSERNCQFLSFLSYRKEISKQ